MLLIVLQNKERSALNKKVCCISGKRDIPPESEKTIREKLRFQIQKAITDSYTVFICGFARGTDIMAAEIIIDFKKQLGNAADIKLDAYLPYDKMRNNKKIKELLKECDDITSCSPYYHRGCFLARDKIMADNADMLIAVTDEEETGGTGYTIRCAEKNKIPIERMLL